MPRIRLILLFLVLSVLFSCNNTNSVSQENKLNSDQKIGNPDEKETSQKENKKITIIRKRQESLIQSSMKKGINFIINCLR